MSQEIRNLEPKPLWNKFADLNAVPRPSKKEERVIEFMKNFGTSLGLETFEDEIRNVIIRKPATARNGKPQTNCTCKDIWIWCTKKITILILILIHKELICMLMVTGFVQKELHLVPTMDLGVAMIMAILESTDIKHPAIEALIYNR
jgi:dipeptidase D